LRYEEGFNRFRLALLADKPEHLSAEASDIFQSLDVDEKTNLHVIGEDAMPVQP